MRLRKSSYRWRFAQEFKAVLRAHKTARATYAPKSYPGPLTLVHCIEKAISEERRSVWTDLASGKTCEIAVLGGHGRERADTFVRPPYVRGLADKLTIHLAGVKLAGCGQD